MNTLVSDAVIVARDQSTGLAQVLQAIPPALVRTVYVVDRGSSDDTPLVAAAHGAIVLGAGQVGDGAACLRGVRHLAALTEPPEVVVFLRPEADDPADLAELLGPIERQRLDLVIGARTLPGEEGKAPLLHRLSRGVAVTLIRAIYGQRYTDLGSFHAIRLPALVALAMTDEGPGWNVEMQVKAVKAGLRVAEVPVRFRAASDEAGPRSLTDDAIASSKMLYTILRHSTTR